MNYALLSGRDLAGLSIVINGAGAAGIRICETLKAKGARMITLCDSKGVIRRDRTDLNPKKREHAVDSRATTVGEALRGAHVFIGVSAANCLKPQDVLSMGSYPAIFAMANPDPEIRPEVVAECMGSKPYVMATGRSDYPNQINNVLGFPFIFRGALDAGAVAINMPMKLAAAEALADLARQPVAEHVSKLYDGESLSFGPNYLIPKPFDRRLFIEIPAAVFAAAASSGAGSAANIAAYRIALSERNDRRFE
jgi:malate dehydrogenase (oxaloacetate-decarboxylating)(NADP+)